MAKEKTTEQLAMQAVMQCQSSPFTEEILDQELPSKLNAPKFDQYNGIEDPTDHIKRFRKYLPLVKEDHLLCLLFQSSLTDPIFDWFHKIPPRSIGSFGE
ncbi:hypothetical protein FRX31_014859 [Thalictrum thalictroides]|uniref:Uncharacterized protein n=1 Tax=Thalictrum thalictroides TaxID=46969 RepID=A0A7J6WDP1_THATH|nr:hypothetical protein FRX31_014859 [Thalictrum thalictroides]